MNLIPRNGNVIIELPKVSDLTDNGVVKTEIMKDNEKYDPTNRFYKVSKVSHGIEDIKEGDFVTLDIEHIGLNIKEVKESLSKRRIVIDGKDYFSVPQYYINHIYDRTKVDDKFLNKYGF